MFTVKVENIIASIIHFFAEKVESGEGIACHMSRKLKNKEMVHDLKKKKKKNRKVNRLCTDYFTERSSINTEQQFCSFQNRIR